MSVPSSLSSLGLGGSSLLSSHSHGAHSAVALSAAQSAQLAAQSAQAQQMKMRINQGQNPQMQQMVSHHSAHHVPSVHHGHPHAGVVSVSNHPGLSSSALSPSPANVNVGVPSGVNVGLGGMNLSSMNSMSGVGNVNVNQLAGNVNVSSAANVNAMNSQAKLHAHVLELTIPERREAALLELSKKREEFPELAPLLWHSFGTIASLLQEIVAIYPLLSPPRLTPMISNRCCNALALLQCVASHPETRSLFLHSHLGLFLYPFLNTVCTFRQYEYLRLTSLGVIGALVKMDDPEVISFLLQTEIIPLCLRIMDNGSELSKTVATFIIQKILLDDMGLNYICATFERFSTVASVLSKMVGGLIERPSVRLLKHIVRCYLRLSDNARAREALRTCLPNAIRDGTFAEVLKDDPTTKRWLAQLLFNIGDQQAMSSMTAAIMMGQQGNANAATGNDPNVTGAINVNVNVANQNPVVNQAMANG